MLKRGLGVPHPRQDWVQAVILRGPTTWVNKYVKMEEILHKGC